MTMMTTIVIILITTIQQILKHGREKECGRRIKKNWTKIAHNTHTYAYISALRRYAHTDAALCGYDLSALGLILPSARGGQVVEVVINNN